ncbi:MAG: DUF1382 family protein [Eubacteriales bacterium]|jgi:hypothetical protein
MIKTTPVQMRKSLEMVDALKKAGIRFVPIPVLNDTDFEMNVAILKAKLNKMERESDET